MFNWVCPQCGKDVPPSKTDCPYCAERAKEAAGAAYQPPPQQAWQPPPPAPSGWQPQPPPPSGGPVWQPPAAAAPPPPPPPPIQPPQPQHAPPPQPGAWPGHPPAYAQHRQNTPWPPPQQRSAPPTWLMGLAFAAAFIVIGAGVIYGVQHFGARTNSAEKAGLENPANPSQQKVSNPLQKYVEVVGIRMVTEGKKPVARFVVVNHSNAEIPDLSANVTLWASTSRSEEDSVGSFSFKVSGLGPNGSQELTSPLKTRLKTYELPDWQNATAEVQVTSPRP